jgi:hypothetical protein
MAKKEQTVTVMPQTDNLALCVKLQGLVTREDYVANCLNEIERRYEKDGEMRVLFFYSPEFEGWTPDGAAANMDNILRFGKFAPRVAFVNPPQKKVLQMKLMPPEVRGREVKFFNADELDDAVTWIKGKVSG